MQQSLRQIMTVNRDLEYLLEYSPGMPDCLAARTRHAKQLPYVDYRNANS